MSLERRPDDELLEVLDSEEFAVKRMHQYAKMLRGKGQAQRYGVYTERTTPGGSLWGVYMVDRTRI